LNSAALGVIADACLSSKRNNKELVIAGIEPTVEEIFNIVYFPTFIKIFVETEAAHGYFQGVKE
jgi:anti-sigma B factor antagonist